jgi:hypothetical protein
VISVVVRTYTQSRLGGLAQYLMHGARHLAAETHDGSPFGETLEVMSEPNAHKRDGLLLTQMAISLAEHERGTPDIMFDAGRDFIAELRLADRPWIAVLHGPPDDAHLHLHLVIRLDDRATGEVQPLARLPRAAFDAATAIAGRYGWDVPKRDNHERRREPRAARSVGVWHGERSLHSWVGEIAGPRILPQIDAARSWAEVGAALADYGLRYERTERGAVLADYSRNPSRKVPASALAFRASANALEQRFGQTPTFPIPEDAERNPRAFANDSVGRSTGVGTAAEHRAFVAEHATWTAVWLPVREEQLDAQRALESSRKASLKEEVLKMRGLRDELAENRAEWLVANSFIREYRSDAGAQLKAQARAERQALAELPFARRPPSRLLEWLRDRNGTASETRLLHAPAAAASNAPLAPDGFRLVNGLTGEAEWWNAHRRVAIDRGNEIVVCDTTCLPIAVASADARWRSVRVGGDQGFRDEALAAATTLGVAVDFDRRAEERPALQIMPDVSGHIGTRRAMAIARHLGVREISLDGKRMRAEVADRRPEPREATVTMLELSQADAVAMNAPAARVTQMENAGYVPAVTVGETAIFALDRSVTSAERGEITRAMLESYGGELQRRFSLEGAIRYGPQGMCDGFRRLLTSLRPHPRPASFAERVQSIQSFLDGFVPAEREPVVVATPTPQPKQTQTRKRGSRSR